MYHKIQHCSPQALAHHLELQPGMAAKQFVLREYADAGVAALKVFMRKEGTQVCPDSVLVRKVASMYHVRSGVLSDY